MTKFKETHYETVLDRIYIRVELNDKWQNASLREALAKCPDQLIAWLEKFSDGMWINATPEIPLTEGELIEAVKWLDGFRPPVRIKHAIFK